jgi:hypothetical protein
MAYGQNNQDGEMTWVEELFDYGNQLGCVGGPHLRHQEDGLQLCGLRDDHHPDLRGHALRRHHGWPTLLAVSDPFGCHWNAGFGRQQQAGFRERPHQLGRHDHGVGRLLHHRDDAFRVRCGSPLLAAGRRRGPRRLDLRNHQVRKRYGRESRRAGCRQPLGNGRSTDADLIASASLSTTRVLARFNGVTGGLPYQTAAVAAATSPKQIPVVLTCVSGTVTASVSIGFSITYNAAGQ